MSRYVIDKTALIENVHYLQKKAGVPIIGVVKGNGYGFGLTELALILEHCGITTLAVTEVTDIAPLRAVLQPNRRHRHRHRRPIGARHRCSSCVRATRGLSPRRRPTHNPATAARPFRRAILPVRSRRATAFSAPTRAVRERHEDGVPALGGAHSGVQSGRFSPGRLPGRRGRKGRKGGGQD